MHQPYEAIIFDCFGVLCTDGWLPFKDKYFSADPDKMRQAADLNKQVDAGLADYNDFITGVAELAGITAGEARNQIDDNVPDNRFFELIHDELKPKYKIGMLSNAGADWLSELFEPAHIAMFDATALSFETGFLKPDEQAYIEIARRLGVALEACVFIDDQERFVTAAKDFGMYGIWHKDFTETSRELRNLLTK